MNLMHNCRPAKWLRALLCVTVAALLFVPATSGIVSPRQFREAIQAVPVAPLTAFQAQRGSQRIDVAKQGLGFHAPFLLARAEGDAARHGRVVVTRERHRIPSLYAVARQSGRAPPSVIS